MAREFDNFLEFIAQLPKTVGLPEESRDTDHDQELTHESLIRDLQDALGRRALVLVLGAGVNKHHELPDWDTLLQKLLMSHVPGGDNKADDYFVALRSVIDAFAPSPLIAARRLKLLAEKEDPTQFEAMVRDVLYEGYDADDYQDRLLIAIRQLCAAPGRERPESVITYNFDNILERYLAHADIRIPFQSICQAGTAFQKELPIYHVHGYLPYEATAEAFLGDHITFSEDAYHRQYSNVYHWANLIQIEKFTHYSCLFIGVSLTDPNLRRLLDISCALRPKGSTPHFVFQRRNQPHEIGDQITRTIEAAKESTPLSEELQRKESVGELTQWLNNVQRADAKSLGVRVWPVDDYAEIPQLLQRLTQ